MNNVIWVDGFCKSLIASAKFFSETQKIKKLFKDWLNEFLNGIPTLYKEKEKLYIAINPISIDLIKWTNSYINHLKNRYKYDVTIPFIWAPGYWSAIIAMAYLCSTNIGKNIFEQWMSYMINYIPCSKCLNHGTAYMITHPPTKYTKSLLLWALEYHNDINKLTNKPSLSYMDFIDKYTVKKSCLNC